MSYILNKPYTEIQRADFVVAHQGLVSVENSDALCFLEPDEMLNENGVIVDNPNYEAEQAQKQAEISNSQVQAQIDELDKKRIRAVAEPSIKNPQTGQTWLEYYTLQIQELRAQLV